MMFDPQLLRESPQLASIELLIQAAEITVIALCAAHLASSTSSGLTQSPPSTGLPIALSIASHACAMAFTSIAGP
jgi:hypothetical protein